MKKLLRIAAAFLALLGSPARAEIEKKVFAPSPTLTKQSLIEAEYGDTNKVVCPRAVHKNLKSLTYVSFGVVLNVDAKRNRIEVVELYPATSVEELDAKIAARTGKKAQEETVVAVAPAPAEKAQLPAADTADTRPNPTPADEPVQTPAPVAPAKDSRTFVGPEGGTHPFDYETVVRVSTDALSKMISMRSEIEVLKEKLNTLPVVPQPAPAIEFDEIKELQAQTAATLATTHKKLLDTQAELRTLEQAKVVATVKAVYDDEEKTQLRKEIKERSHQAREETASRYTLYLVAMAVGAFFLLVVTVKFMQWRHRRKEQDRERTVSAPAEHMRAYEAPEETLPEVDENPQPDETQVVNLADMFTPPIIPLSRPVPPAHQVETFESPFVGVSPPPSLVAPVAPPIVIHDIPPKPPQATPVVATVAADKTLELPPTPPSDERKRITPRRAPRM